MKEINISIDYDKTLTRDDVFQLIFDIINYTNINVYVLTYRYDDLHQHHYDSIYGETGNEDLWERVDSLGLCRSKVIFTNCKPKSEYLNSCKNVLFHLDDDKRVMEDITRNCKYTFPIQLNSPKFVEKMANITRKYAEEKGITLNKY